MVGKIKETQGHEVPSCRMVRLSRSDTGAMMWFRIPDTGREDGIMSVTLTALASGLSVVITYDPAVTSGCGSEPKISYISILSANSRHSFDLPPTAKTPRRRQGTVGQPSGDVQQ